MTNEVSTSYPATHYTHLDHVLLHTLRVRRPEDAEQLVIRDEEEAWERVALRVQVVVERLLALLKAGRQVCKVRQPVWCVARLLNVRHLSRVRHDL